LIKRRHMSAAVPAAPTLVDEAGTEINVPGAAAGNTVGGRKQYKVVDIPDLMHKLEHETQDPEAQLEGIRGFRRMLSAEHNPPVQAVLDAGALPYFVNLLSHFDPDVQFEAAWAITNVASTEHTASVVECNAIPFLVGLLMSVNPNVREQCAWCLGNIAGDSPKLRDTVLRAGAMEPLLENIKDAANASLLNNAVWTLSNFCRGKPQPELDLVAPALPVLAALVMNPPNPEALLDACWAISYLSDGSDDRIQAVMDARVPAEEFENVTMTQTLVKLLDHENTAIVTPALRVLGNFVSGSDTQTQAVLDAGVLKMAFKLFKSSKRSIRKETFWLLSNVAAGTPQQINAIVRSQAHLQHAVLSMQNAEFEIRKEAMWVVNNIITGGTDEHVILVCTMGAIASLSSMLTVNDPKVLEVVLDALEKIFLVGEKREKNYTTLFDEADGIDRLEALQEHENEEVYEKAINLLELFFGASDENENENLAPQSDGNTFSFGLSQKVDVASQVSGGNGPMSFNFQTTNV
jgi:importin subunit alpha-1